jgi:hypothetical protein
MLGWEGIAVYHGLWVWVVLESNEVEWGRCCRYGNGIIGLHSVLSDGFFYVID